MYDFEQRNFGRLKLEVSGFITLGDKAPLPCVTHDISYCGARLTTGAVGQIGAEGTLNICEIGNLKCSVVRVLRDGFAVEFNRNMTSTEMLRMLTEHRRRNQPSQTA